MLIDCPVCACRHDLPEAVALPGRLLRCGSCREVFRLETEPDLDIAALEAPVAADDGREIVVEARSGREAPRLPDALPRGGSVKDRARRPGRGRSRRLARSLSSLLAGTVIVTTLGGGMAAVAAREAVVRAFPSSAAVFATIGLPVNLRGLALADLHSSLETDGGTPTLTIEGRVLNLRAASAVVPALHVAIRDARGRDLYGWTIPAPKPRLAGGEDATFRARLAAPPSSGERVAVSFVEGETPRPSPRGETTASGR